MEKDHEFEEQQGEVCGRVWRGRTGREKCCNQNAISKIKKKKNLGSILQIVKFLLLNSLS